MRCDVPRGLVILASILASCAREEPPAITSVAPERGSARGGGTITIEGHGFGASPKVRFEAAGDGPASRLADITPTHVSDTKIEIVAPPHVAGSVDLRVTVNGTELRREDAYTYLPLPFTFVESSLTRLPSRPVDGANVELVDIDRDGDLDAIQASHLEGVTIYVNDGKGAFSKAMTVVPDDAIIDVSHVVARDFDGDGEVDLLLLTEGSSAARLLFGRGKLSFEARSGALPPLFGARPTAIAVDLDGDEDLDLVLTGVATTEGGAKGVAVLSNDGKGKLTDVTEKRLAGGSFDASGVAAGDVDGDGDQDLFFAGDQAPCRLYANDGRGALSLASPDAIPYDPAPQAGIPALGDIDGDGSLDVYLPSQGQDRILLNDGSGRFDDLTDVLLGPESGLGASAIVSDLDLDGHADVIVMDKHGPLHLYHNDGTGRLFDYSGEVMGRVTGDAGGLAIGDVDGDGDLDIFASHAYFDRAALFLSFSPLPTKDQDGDGIPDVADNCPLVPNPDQQNLDSLPFRCAGGPACKSETGCDLHALGGSAYLACASPAVSFAEAAAFCAARGAGLVTIDTDEENAFVAGIGADGWIGYSDAATEGTYVWVGGESAYQHWAMGQPDDAGGNEDCASIGADGAWNDLPCDALRGFVCEDARSRVPDPGDACDPCASVYDPESEPVASDAGACPGGGGGAP